MDSERPRGGREGGRVGAIVGDNHVEPAHEGELEQLLYTRPHEAHLKPHSTRQFSLTNSSSDQVPGSISIKVAAGPTTPP